MSTFDPTRPAQKVDVDLIRNYGVPVEYRLLNVKTGKFVGSTNEKPFVSEWRDAAYFSSTVNVIVHPASGEPSIDGDEESTLLFQWEWNRDEAGADWLNDEDIQDYRVHVVLGESYC